MTNTNLLSLVQKSRLLTEQEKTYWAASLPRMSDEQKERLEGILHKAETIPWTKKIEQYLSLIGNTFTKQTS